VAQVLSQEIEISREEFDKIVALSEEHVRKHGDNLHPGLELGSTHKVARPDTNEVIEFEVSGVKGYKLYAYGPADFLYPTHPVGVAEDHAETPVRAMIIDKHEGLTYRINIGGKPVGWLPDYTFERHVISEPLPVLDALSKV
jgi:hypothetical protein